MPPTYTDEGLRLAAGIRSHHPGRRAGALAVPGGVVRRAAPGHSPERVGYLLKDNVLRVEVSRRAAAASPAAAPSSTRCSWPDGHRRHVPGGPQRTGARGARPDGRGALRPGDRRPADRSLQTVYTHVQHVFAKLDLPARPRTTVGCAPSSPTWRRGRVEGRAITRKTIRSIESTVRALTGGPEQVRRVVATPWAVSIGHGPQRRSAGHSTQTRFFGNAALAGGTSVSIQRK